MCRDEQQNIETTELHWPAEKAQNANAEVSQIEIFKIVNGIYYKDVTERFFETSRTDQTRGHSKKNTKRKLQTEFEERQL